MSSMKQENAPSNSKGGTVCQTCAGSGEVWHKSLEKDHKNQCPSCRGTGERADQLRKVLPMSEMDLRK